MKKYKYILTIILVIFIIIFVLIKLIDKKLNQDLILVINQETVVLNRQNAEIEIDLNSFNSEHETVVYKKQGVAYIEVNGKSLDGSEKLNLGNIAINDESKILVEVTYIDGSKTKFLINTLPSLFPSYKADGESKYDGDYYMSTYSFDYDSDHYIFKTDEKGNLIYYKKTNFVSFDFRKEMNSSGQVRYMYLEATDNNFEGILSILPCDLVIMDENYNEINRVRYVDKNGNLIGLDNHAYYYIDDEHYILASYVKRKKEMHGEIVYVFDCLIEEIKDGKILWQFDSGEYLDLYNASTVLEEASNLKDYIHINSMWIDDNDGNVICSFRNIDGVLKIDRKSGEIIWLLGGMLDEFGLNEYQKFSKQHSAIYTSDNNILIYDNGNDKKKSRIVKIKLDEQNKKVLKYEEYDLGLFAYMMGSVRVINEDDEIYLICYGGGHYIKDSVEEINYSTGEVDFKFTFLENKLMYNVNKIR